MYKGYIESDGKIPKTKIKDVELNCLDTMLRKRCDYVGVLKDEIVMIDFDDPDEFQNMLKVIEGEKVKCSIIRTSRGGHFYFRATDKHVGNKIHVKTPLGFTVDIKLGSKNTVDPLRLMGTTREWIQLYKGDELDSAPFWLDPMRGGKDLSETNSRNDSMYRYILPLQASGYSVPQIREIIRMINDYILENPLNMSELDTILRDESFTKPSFIIKGKLLHDEFSRWMVNEENLFKIEGDDSERVYTEVNGNVVSKDTVLDKMIIKHLPSLTASQIKEVRARIDLVAPEKEVGKCEDIKIKNGVFNIKDDNLTDYSFGVIPNRIPYAYNPEAYHELVDITLNRIACQDKKIRALLEEVVGYCLYRRNELGKSFFLVGNGSNGKSTFIKMLTTLLGRQNVSTIDLEELGNRFKAQQVQGKLLNVGDDIGDGFIEDIKTFKKLVTGDAINVEKKGMDAYDLHDIYCKFIFSCNSLPRISDTSGGIMRRIEVIPFKANFKRDGGSFDQYIIDKLTTDEAMEYLLMIGLKGLQRVLENRGFTEVEASVEAKKEFELDNNPILRFVEEFDGINGRLTSDVYSSYKYWCEDCGYKYLSLNKFTTILKDKLDIISKVSRLNGKICRVYVKN